MFVKLLSLIKASIESWDFIFLHTGKISPDNDSTSGRGWRVLFHFSDHHGHL